MNIAYFIFLTFYLLLSDTIFSGEFLTRNTSDNKNLKKKNLNIELLKADYEAVLDKLICPSCKNEQSFDENFEKIRECRRCNEKFVRAKKSNSSFFAKTNKKNEEKRLLRLKNIEDGVYGNLGNFIRYIFLSHLNCFEFIVCQRMCLFIFIIEMFYYVLKITHINKRTLNQFNEHTHTHKHRENANEAGLSGQAETKNK